MSQSVTDSGLTWEGGERGGLVGGGVAEGQGELIERYVH